MNEEYLKVITERQTIFDENLRIIEQYKYHPEMLPFVGKNYGNNGEQKILLVYESHYLKNDALSEDLFSRYDWYNMYLKDIPELKEEYYGVGTRWVASQYASGVKARWLKIFYRPFYKLYDFGITSEGRDRDFIEKFAYMNFFQRPVVGKNDSIKNAKITENDIKIAKLTLNQVVDILKPDKIFVMSSYVRDRLEQVDYINGIKVYYMVHPSRSWWTADEGKYGYRKFIDYYNE